VFEPPPQVEQHFEASTFEQQPQSFEQEPLEQHEAYQEEEQQQPHEFLSTDKSVPSEPSAAPLSEQSQNGLDAAPVTAEADGDTE
jgi:hypothetical protein